MPILPFFGVFYFLHCSKYTLGGEQSVREGKTGQVGLVRNNTLFKEGFAVPWAGAGRLGGTEAAACLALADETVLDLRSPACPLMKACGSPGRPRRIECVVFVALAALSGASERHGASYLDSPEINATTPAKASCSYRDWGIRI